MKYWLIFLLALPIAGFAQHPYPADSNKQPTLEEMFTVKETFKYEVRFSFILLGWVEVELLSDTLYNGKVHKHIFTEMRSNPKIPFIGKEIDRFNSFFYVNNDGLPVTSTYWKDNIDEGRLDEIRYHFDREKQLVYSREKDGSRDTLNLVEPASAGHIVFYLSRLFAGADTTMVMPVYTSSKKGDLVLNSNSEKEIRKYAAFDEPIEAYLTTGTTRDIDGPFGFSGNFKAWFLSDNLRVPLEARVRVFFGNATVKLTEYTRKEL